MKKILIICLAALSLSMWAQESANNAKEIRQLERKIALELGKVEGNLPQINILAKKGEKVQAKAMVEEALQQIERIEADQKRLALLDASLDEETLMIGEVQETKQILINQANRLRYTAIYLQCEAKNFGNEYAALLGEIQGALSDESVAFVDSANVSDWAITITANAREYSKADFNGVSSYIAYVDAKTVVEKTVNGKRIYDNTFTEKGGSPISFDQAAAEAYKRLSPKICAALKEQINQ